MNYSKVLSYLESLSEFRIKLGLERIRALLEELGEPQRSYPVVLIAGTNGKGSVGAFLSSILMKKYKVGFNSSPHLIFPEERIRLQLKPIEREQFAYFITEIKKASEKINRRFSHPVTFFETMTAAAFLAFKETSVDIGIFEVGMGGRLDATNTADAVLSVITDISYDHVKTLGRRLAQIAYEKAQTIKPGRHVLTGSEKEFVLDVIKREAHRKKATLHFAFSPLRRLLAEGKGENLSFIYLTSDEGYQYKPSLRGFHQGKNAALAIAAAEILRKEGFDISKEEIIEGIETAFWPGRIEKIKDAPEIIIDAAHNAEGAQALASYLYQLPKKRNFLVFGLLRDKDFNEISRILFPLFSRIVLTEPPSHRRLEAEEMFDRATSFAPAEVIKNPVKAVEKTLKQAEESDRIVICGSIYLVGKAREYFLEKGWVSQL